MIEEQVLADCLTFEDRLNDLVDSRLELSNDPLLVQHSQECAVCARLLMDYQQLLGAHPLNEIDQEANVVIGRPRQSSRLPMQTSKLKWAISLTPSIAALLIVTISILKGSGAPQGIAGNEASWEQLGGLHQVDIQTHSTGQLAAKDSKPLPASPSAFPYDPIVGTVFIKSGVADGVQGYSNAIYQLANSQTQLRACDWQLDVVSKVTTPFAPIHNQVPYRGEFSTIPQIRFLLGFTLRLIEITFTGQLQLDLDLMKPNLGSQTEYWQKAAIA